jgi:hypothetical protein
MSFLDIKVTFLHVGEDTALPTLMVASVLKAMPDAQIIQLTDDTTPKVKGVTSVVRKPYDGVNLMTYRMSHLADLEGDWITLDTDILVMKDLRVVFDKDFDVALTRRYGTILSPDGIDIVESMPYNTGVMFSRNKLFWENAYKTLLGMPESAHRWWGDQLSVRLAAEGNRFNVLELSCDTYNYTPKDDKDRKDVFVYHFKGNRKDWMKHGDYKLFRATDSDHKVVKQNRRHKSTSALS